MRAPVLALLLTACATPPKTPPAPSKPAIVQGGPLKLVTTRFRADGIAPETASIVESAFCNAMTQAGVRTACSEEIDMLARSVRAAPVLRDCDTEQGPCGGALEEVANVREFATGVVIARDGGFVLEVSIVDKETSQERRRESVRTATAPDLLDAVDVLVARLAAP